jgi:hypothetical protein
MSFRQDSIWGFPDSVLRPQSPRVIAAVYGAAPGGVLERRFHSPFHADRITSQRAWAYLSRPCP